ncbi:cytochrome P450 [Chytriomyces cf. hyalinus JEL632]|nr:cytochrome P450 [Chytriomyces cf. hyalinus JEL632]
MNCLPWLWPWKRLDDQYSKIPSMPQYPFIGSYPSFKEFLAKDTVNLYFRKCHKELGPVIEHNLFGNKNVSVADPDISKQILSGPHFGRHDFLIANSRDIIEFALFGMSTGPIWKSHRKAIVAGLGPQFVKNSYAASIELMQDFVRLLNLKINDSASGETEINIRTYLSAVTLDIIMRVACNTDIHCLETCGDEVNGDSGVRKSQVKVAEPDSEDYFAALRVNIDKISQVLFTRVFVPPFLHGWVKVGRKRMKPLADFFKGMAASVLEPRKGLRAAPDRDLVSILLAEEKDGTRKFSDKEASDELVALLLAGHETTANTLTNVFLRVTQDARVLKRLQEEIDGKLGPNENPLLQDLAEFKYLDNVFRETQRVHPVVMGVGRLAVEDTEFETGDVKYKIQKGTEVFVSIQGMMFSEELWGLDVEVFNPDRWDNPVNEAAFLPFGGGPHKCPGMKMAVMESKVSLIKLFQNFNFELVEGQDLVHRDGVTVHLKDGLRLRVRRRGEQ